VMGVAVLAKAKSDAAARRSPPPRKRCSNTRRRACTDLARAGSR
jgi:hypothetical protein